MATGYLTFRIGETRGVLPLAHLREVLPFAHLERPPGLPAVVEGFLNLGGTLHPVVRLDRALGLPEFALTSAAHLIRPRAEGPICLVERALEVWPDAAPVETCGEPKFVRRGDEVAFVLDITALGHGFAEPLDAAARALGRGTGAA